MSVPGQLIAYGIHYLFDASADRAIATIEKWWADHSQLLPRALARANDRAWQAVGFALGAGGLVGRLKGLVADGDLKAVRDHVHHFVAHTPTGFDGTSEDVCRQCLAELGRLRACGRLTTLPPVADVVRRFAEPTELIALHAAGRRAAAARGRVPVLLPSRGGDERRAGSRPSGAAWRRPFGRRRSRRPVADPGWRRPPQAGGPAAG